jgi:hypothetical protein
MLGNRYGYGDLNNSNGGKTSREIWQQVKKQSQHMFFLENNAANLFTKWFCLKIE